MRDENGLRRQWALLRLLYQAESDAIPTHRVVHPYGVVYHRGSLYLVALDTARGRIRHDKIDRVDAVEVRFASCVARYVREARRHESQVLEPQADGGVLARFTVSGTEEIKRWILGFGARAEVVRPEGLRREVVEELRVMLAIYSVPLGG